MSNTTPASDDLSTRLAVDDLAELESLVAARENAPLGEGKASWDAIAAFMCSVNPATASLYGRDIIEALVPSPTEPSRRETVAVTEEAVEAAARSDAAFDGRPIETLGRVERDRYRARAHRALEAAALSVTGGAEGDRVLVPRDLIGSACSAIDKKRNAPKTLAALRKIAMGPAALASPPTAGEDADGWVSFDDRRPTEREWTEEAPFDWPGGVSTAYDDETGEPLFLVWWQECAGVMETMHHRPLPSPPSPTASKGGK